MYIETTLRPLWSFTISTTRFIEMPVRRHMQEESSPRRGLWSHDVIDDVRPVSDADMTTVPSFANRWHIHVPVCMPFNTPAPTDTARAKVRVKVKLKVKVKKDQPKPLTVDLSEGKDTNMYEVRVTDEYQ